MSSVSLGKESESERVREQYREHLRKLKEQPVQRESARSRSRSRSPNNLVSPREQVSSFESKPNRLQTHSSKEVAFKVLNESSFDQASLKDSQSMESIYRRIQNLRNTLKNSSSNLEVSASLPLLKESRNTVFDGMKRQTSNGSRSPLRQSSRSPAHRR